MLGNRYVIGSLIGKGGMGQVFRGTDRFTKKPVAIKGLLPEFLRSEKFRLRFAREGESLFNVGHPNIVQFLAFWEDSGREPFLVMELLEGQSLRSLLDGSPTSGGGASPHILPPFQAVACAVQVLDGLYHLHSLPRTLVHRDVKPENIWVLPTGTVKLMDLGIAKELQGKALTAAGQHGIGTVEYMSPEEIQGFRLTPAADQYSFGVTLYCKLCGRVPFIQITEVGMEVLDAHVHAPPPDPREFAPDLPDFLVRALARSLQKSPPDRFPSCFAMKRWLLSEGREAA